MTAEETALLIKVFEDAGIDLSGLKGKLPGTSIGAILQKIVSGEIGSEQIAARGEIATGLERVKGENQQALRNILSQSGMDMERVKGEQRRMTNQEAALLDELKDFRKAGIENRAATAVAEKALVDKLAADDLMSRAARIAGSSMTLTPELLAMQQQVRQLPGGEALAEGINTIVSKNAERETQRKIEELRKMVGPDVVDSIGVDNITPRVRAGLELGTLDLAAEASAVQGKYATAQNQERLASAQARHKQKLIRVGVPEAKAEQAVQDFVRIAKKGNVVKVNRGALEAEVSSARRGSMLKKGLVGGLGGAVGVALLSKILGQEKQQVSPETQMALIQQLQGGGGQGEQEPEGLRQGRDLLNLSRTLGIIKMMQEMAGLSQGHPQVAQVV